MQKPAFLTDITNILPCLVTRKAALLKFAAAQLTSNCQSDLSSIRRPRVVYEKKLVIILQTLSSYRGGGGGGGGGGDIPHYEGTVCPRVEVSPGGALP